VDGFKLTLPAATKYDEKCDSSMYVHPDGSTSDVNALAAAAAAHWYGGNSVYDYKTGDMTEFTAAAKQKYENFGRMLWKASTKAAFGMIESTDGETKRVVAYYCADRPVVRDLTNPPAVRTPKEVLENVGRLCKKDGYNVCYNERALARHNERREAHSGYVPLVLDTGIAKAIQAQLEAAGFTGTIANADKGKYANCGENTFVLTDQTKLSSVALSNLASDFWYDGHRFWDIAAGAAKATNTAAQTSQANNFAQMLWQGTTKVGFGVHKKYVVAWYCEDKAELGDAAKAAKHIGTDCTARGYNECFNTIALKYANKVRNNHDVRPLKLDVPAARAIQVLLRSRAPGKFMLPLPQLRPYYYRGCYQSLYLETDAAAAQKLSSSATAAEYWYGGVKYYDYANNRHKSPTTGWEPVKASCHQAVGLNDQYDYTAKKYRALKAHNPKSTQTFTECLKRCASVAKDADKGHAEGCVAAEVGPKGSCQLYIWDKDLAGHTATPVDSKLAKDVHCWMRPQWHSSSRSANFENMVWKSAETVAFGVRSPWAVAWYCRQPYPKALRARTETDRKANVLQTQIVNGYNAAYNKVALRTHNEKRARH